MVIFPGCPVILLVLSCAYSKHRPQQQAEYLQTYGRSGSFARAFTLRPGGCWFNPRPSHTKDFKNGTSCSFACAQHWEGGTDRPSVNIMWLDGISHYVSGAWYFREHHSKSWALSSLSDPDIVAIWLKYWWKRRSTRIKWKNKPSDFLSVLQQCKGRAMRKHIFGNMRTSNVQISLRIRAVWSEPSLSTTESLGTIECFSGESGWDFTHVQDAVYPHILRMPEGTFP